MNPGRLGIPGLLIFLNFTWIFVTVFAGIILLPVFATGQEIPVKPIQIPQPRFDSITDSTAYLKSQVFYDSIFKKFSRKKVTRLLYGLAFADPGQPVFADKMQVIQSASPYEKYRNKTIRNIHIKILSPFGSSVYDTIKTAGTTTGKALNKLHINTMKFFILRNILFHKGDCLDPSVLADNVRILKDLDAIDDAKIIVTPTLPPSDSVDITVITKDVWSIGIDVPMIATRKIGFRIFDGNFMGLGDGITTSMSLSLNRAPFFLFEGVTYTFSNLAGSFINATVLYNTNDEGEQTVGIRFDKGFITNKTKWAGGISAFYQKKINAVDDFNTVDSYNTNEGLWLGRAMLLKGQMQTSRAVVTAAFYNQYYSSRPIVTIDSNRGYYNVWQALSSIALSKNNYYITDYVLQFGKIENLSYGHLFEITGGVENTDFYKRCYTGARIGVGNFFYGFGYLSGFVRAGGFIHENSYEDCVFKMNLNYFTPLLQSRDKQYKFRTFLSIDYRIAFNSRSNNSEYFDANQFFKINKLNRQDVLYGQKSIGAKLSAICFTPWYFYGFRFALLAQLQAGMITDQNQSVFSSSFFTSAGISLIIKNDNLIFPPVLISAFFYPGIQSYYNQFQLFINSNMNIQYDDFNVGPPHQETISN
ncbi:MAG: hypothetical protein NT004_13255 [Bacteroidetes bacterium]|nr:hypothetical protein [Bacteroidota bacterium]